jgi:lysosomal acid lipase/cholesteryl ester hydrolase
MMHPSPFITLFFVFSLKFVTSIILIDPDYDATPEQLILSRGFEYQRHDIESKDGYILRTDRIIHPFLNSTGLPVILMHGFMSSSRDFIINAPGGDVNESTEIVGNNLGFELARRGFDVWLPNERGNLYSQDHKLYQNVVEGGLNLNPKYWDFSYADMAKYSIPSIIDYVRTTTQSEHVAYIGHSRGTMVMFGALSLYPYLNEVVKPFIAMSPVMTLSNMTHGIHYLANLKVTEYILGGRMNFPIQLPRPIARRNCPPGIDLDGGVRCARFLNSMGGDDIKLFNMSRVNVYMNGISTISSKDLKLFRQNVRTGRFAEYDYGPMENLLLYNSTEPPVFPMDKIENRDIHLISGSSDTVSCPENTHEIRKILGDKIKKDIVVPIPTWGHQAMLWGRETWKYVNTPIIDILTEYL